MTVNCECEVKFHHLRVEALVCVAKDGVVVAQDLEGLVGRGVSARVTPVPQTLTLRTAFYQLRFIWLIYYYEAVPDVDSMS